ncbi:dimethyladenosine transferase [Chthoniobacter flavus Ellin428]|uniref:Ribosomal RNA small subunit methyltransferase A n=1 Tax=Chthoniobacter flavus Ellin428 TaxID=497964 RepID=B4CU73_9BACT|nr:16S rRNA (adenine(1518)-N(6)/adenine(1519)-N(6))-dimethyltransferase RsmA [Chthoniobacter flavus]EDY22111.1 dimethyladenosine transferase [Chthoniobacter flavus Ellin428]TCO94855.1 16S rRNA (adenine1518-N6/adenine1519-N6)-dimethyltransferase [Chthoniobacter flavus]
MKLSTIQASLNQLGMQPTKSLGQNFLHDQNLAEWIVAQLDIQPEEAWVELGPGLGALTEFALARSPRGLVIEKDGRLAGFLRERFPALEIIHGDASEFDVRELFARGPIKVLGNLPYYVSSQILFAFTGEPSPVSALIFTLQKELAERLSAGPWTKEYGALTLLVGRRWKVKYLRTLPGSVFMPAPKVDSAIVLLTPRPAGEVPACDGELFTRLVKQGFAQRRKQLRKNLAGRNLDWPALCQHLGVEETTRAEELSLEQWIALTNFVTKSSDPGHSSSVIRHSAAADLANAAQDVHGEIFDVVDEEDRVTGQLSRHEVHRQKLLHRAVHILVFNSRGELFLQRRSRWKDVHPLRWDSSAAGHVNSGDTYAGTAPREIVEELGVSAEVEEIGKLPPSPATGWEHVRLYRAHHDGPFKLNPAELDGGGFFTLEQIDRWTTARPEDFATGFLECWKHFRALAQ